MTDNHTRAKTVGATIGVSVVAALTLWTQTEVSDLKAEVGALRSDVSEVSEIREDIQMLRQQAIDIAASQEDISAAINRAIERAVRKAVRKALEEAAGG